MKHLLCLFIFLCSLQAAAAQTKSADIGGSWSGKLSVTPQNQLTVTLHFAPRHGSDSIDATFDSPDQGAFGISAAVDYLSDDSVSVSISRLGVTFSGAKHGTDSLSGKFAQGAFTAPLLLTRERTTERPQTPRPPFPYTSTEVKIENHEAPATLAGTLTLPDGADSSTPVVVMVSGSGLQNRDEELFGHKPFAVIADHLARNGIASLRYDDRGFGKSTGDPSSATTRDFSTDAKAIVDYLRSTGRFSSVGILGHSEGAEIAFMLGASQVPDFIVAVGAPAVRGDSIIADQLAVKLREGFFGDDIARGAGEIYLQLLEIRRNHGTESALSALDSLTAKVVPLPVMASMLKPALRQTVSLNQPWMNFFVDYSPAADIAATRCPALVLEGEKDTQVSPALNLAPMERLLNGVSTVKVMPGLNHLMQHAKTGSGQEYGLIEETFAPEALDEIVGFIVKVTQTATSSATR